MSGFQAILKKECHPKLCSVSPRGHKEKSFILWADPELKLRQIAINQCLVRATREGNLPSQHNLLIFLLITPSQTSAGLTIAAITQAAVPWVPTGSRGLLWPSRDTVGHLCWYHTVEVMIMPALTVYHSVERAACSYWGIITAFRHSRWTERKPRIRQGITLWQQMTSLMNSEESRSELRCCPEIMAQMWLFPLMLPQSCL